MITQYWSYWIDHTEFIECVTYFRNWHIFLLIFTQEKKVSERRTLTVSICRRQVTLLAEIQPNNLLPKSFWSAEITAESMFCLKSCKMHKRYHSAPSAWHVARNQNQNDVSRNHQMINTWMRTDSVCSRNAWTRTDSIRSRVDWRTVSICFVQLIGRLNWCCRLNWCWSCSY